MQNAQYILKVGEEAAKRLDYQHELMRKQAETHIAKTKLKAGDTVIDIGSGSGAMTSYFAQLVGEKGRVIACDISDEQLAQTRKKIDSLSLPYHNVDYIKVNIQEDAHELQKLFGTADLVYTRVVLMHLTDPKQAIANIHKLLKIGGQAASQESIFSAVYAKPHHDLLSRHFKARVDYATAQGINYNIGIKLPELYANKNLAVENYYIEDFMMSFKDGGNMFVTSAIEMKDKYVAGGFMSAEEADAEIVELKKLTDSDTEMFFMQAHIIAQKI